jgi:hypothetical protein
MRRRAVGDTQLWWLPNLLIVFGFGFTALIAVTTDIPFWVPLTVLTFNFILAGLICARLQKRNPDYDKLDHATGSPSQVFSFWVGAVALASWGVSWKYDLPYFTAFACAFLLVTTSQSELVPERCGQLELSFLLFLSFLIGVVLLILVHDGIQSHRGRLSGLMKWLRTLPAAVAMLIAVATFGFRLLW